MHETQRERLTRGQVVAVCTTAALFAILIATLAWGHAMAKDESDLTDVPQEYADLESVVIVGADSTSKGSAGEEFGEEVAQRANEITGGKLTIDYHANGDLGGDADLLRQVQYDDIQLVVCQPAAVVSFVPEMAVFDLPMAFATYDSADIDTVLNGDGDFRQQLDAAYEAQGLHLLGFLQNATFRVTTSNRALYDLDDFEGLQIRTMENSNHMAFWSAIGAEPTPLAWAEVYISLQNGTVDAEENAADTCASSSFQEVQDYLACTNHILYCNQVCINEECWESLDPAYQAALEQAVEESIADMQPKMAEIDQESKDELTSGGMELIEYDESFFQEVLALDAVQDLYVDIDEQTGGLGSVLTGELAQEAASGTGTET